MPQVNPNIYSGGAAVINSSPYTNFAINLMARKAAKEDALDQYYRSLDKQVNGAGMRNQDVNYLMQNENARRQFYMENRDKILNPRKDNGAAQTQFQQLFQNSVGIVNESKAEEAKKKPVMDLFSDPNKRDRVTQKLMNDIHLHDLPLNDPNRKSLDIVNNDYFNPKELSVKEMQDMQDNFGKGIAPDKNEILITPHPQDRFSQIETTTARYSPDKLKAIGEDARNAYLNSNSLQYTFDKSHKFNQFKEEHTDEFNRLNNVYKSVYGTDIADNDDLFTATALQRKSEPTVTAKRIDNKAAIRAETEAFDLKKLAIEHNDRINEKQTATWKELHPNDTNSSGFNDMYGRMKDAVYSVDYKQYKGLPMNRLDNDSQDFVNTFVNKQVHLDKGAKLENSDYYVAPSENGKDVAVYLTKERAAALNRPQLVGSFSEASTNPKVNTNKAKQTSIQHASNGNAKKGILD